MKTSGGDSYDIRRRFKFSSLSYDPAAQLFFNSLPTQPNSAVKNAYNNAFVNYPTLISLHDILYWDIAQYEDNKRTTLVNPASYYQSIIGSMTFAQFGGITGAANSVYNSGFIPSTNAINYTLDNACFWFFNATTAPSFNKYVGGCSIFGEGGQISAKFNNNPGMPVGINNFAFFTADLSAQSYYGLWSVVLKSSVITVYHNGVSIGTSSHGGAALPDCSDYEGGFDYDGSLSGTYPCYDGNLFGRGICSGDISQTDLYNMVTNLMADMPMDSYYGDSITKSQDASGEYMPATSKWSYLNSQSHSLFPYNRAMTGSTSSGFIAGGEKMRKLSGSQKCYIGYNGVNDIGAGISAVTMASNLQTIIDNGVADGVPKSQMVGIAGWHITNATLLLGGYLTTYVPAAIAVYISNGIAYKDLSGLSYSLEVDGIHPLESAQPTIFNFINS